MAAIARLAAAIASVSTVNGRMGMGDFGNFNIDLFQYVISDIHYVFGRMAPERVEKIHLFFGFLYRELEV